MPGLVAGLEVDDFALEAAALDPAQVHAQQHLGPVLRLGTAGAGMDRHDRVLAIVLAAEHLLGLAGVDEGRELIEGAAEIVGHRLPRLRPLDEDMEILDAAGERLAQFAVLFEAATALQHLLGTSLILPEIRGADAFFYSRELDFRAGGVKDGSAGRWRGAPDPRACEAARRVAKAKTPVVARFTR